MGAGRSAACTGGRCSRAAAAPGSPEGGSDPVRRQRGARPPSRSAQAATGPGIPRFIAVPGPLSVSLEGSVCDGRAVGTPGGAGGCGRHRQGRGSVTLNA